MKLCSVCQKEINADSAPILTMGGFGNPKYLCDECALDMDFVTGGKVPEEIEGAMQKISEKMSFARIDDRVVIDAVSEIFSEAGKRAKRISEGTYDFSQDEREDADYDIPDELLESEEDKLLDEKEFRINKKIESVLNWITLGVFSAAVIFIIVYFLF